MADQCSNCFFGQRIDAGSFRMCCHDAPAVVDQGSGNSTARWKPVADSDWCGEGADNATGRSYGPTPIQISGSFVSSGGASDTVSCTTVTAGSKIFLQQASLGGGTSFMAWIDDAAIVPGVSFTVEVLGGTAGTTVNYLVVG